MKEKKLLTHFLDEIRKPDGGLAVYGEKEVLSALELGAIDILLVSEGTRKRTVVLSCRSCGHIKGKTVVEGKISTAPCPKCQSTMEVGAKNIDIIEELISVAENFGTKVELISSDSEEGDMFLRAFGGLAGVLRYKMKLT